MNEGPSDRKIVPDLAARIPLRANSAIITIFGEGVVTHGGNIWLGSLIKLAAPLGISERLVRTGVYRLTRQNWLVAERRGRRSYYSAPAAAGEKFHEAQRRIYAEIPAPWDREWRLVQLPRDLDTKRRQLIASELGWLGFGQIGTLLFAHPTEKTAVIRRTLARHGVEADCLVFRARLADFVSSGYVLDVVSRAWDLPALNQEYARFIETFSPVNEQLASGVKLDDRDAFAVRIYLMHDYRRILLKDPVLPDALLPEEWLGNDARQLTGEIYRRVITAADRFLTANMETVSGTLPAPDESYTKRFAGPAPERRGARIRAL
jgi:phenylacetic acid degradation operon negative regulatory protein